MTSFGYSKKLPKQRKHLRKKNSGENVWIELPDDEVVSRNRNLENPKTNNSDSKTTKRTDQKLLQLLTTFHKVQIVERSCPIWEQQEILPPLRFAASRHHPTLHLPAHILSVMSATGRRWQPTCPSGGLVGAVHSPDRSREGNNGPCMWCQRCREWPERRGSLCPDQV